MRTLWHRLVAFCRGTPNGWNLFLSVLLGFLIGAIPGYAHSWLLTVLLVLLLVLLNTNILLAAAAVCVSKLITIVFLPWEFALGVFLIEEAASIFGYLINAPVTAFFGLAYYATTGSLVVGGMIGFVSATMGIIVIPRIHGKIFSGAASQAGSSAFFKVFFGKRDELVSRASEHESFQTYKLFRPSGLTCVLILVAVGLLTGIAGNNRVLSYVLENELSRLNGATVDIGHTVYKPLQSRLVLKDLAAANPENLNQNFIAASRVVMDISNTALLADKWVADEVRIEDVDFASSRHAQASLVGEKTSDGVIVEQIDIAPFFEKIQIPAVLTEHLEQIQRWIQVLCGERPGRDFEGKRPLAGTDEYLYNLAEKKGYANVKARDHVADTPKYCIRSFTMKGVQLSQLENDILHMEGENLCSNPALLDKASYFELNSNSGNLFLRVRFHPESKKKDEPRSTIRVNLTDIPLSMFGKALDLKQDLRFIAGRLSLQANGRIYPSPLDVPLHFTIENPEIKVHGDKTIKGKQFYFRSDLKGSIINPQMEFVQGDQKSQFTEELIRIFQERIEEKADEWLK